MPTSLADLSELAFWSQPLRARDETYAVLRREEPVSFQKPPAFGLAGMMPFPYPGYWAVTTHELVKHVTTHPDVFCSGEGAVLEDAGLGSDLRERIGSFLAMDGRRHSELRRLVSSAFTPRNVARIESRIADRARQIVDGLVETGDCDFVEHVATQLPMWTISDMVGIPEADRKAIVHAANTVVSTSDPEIVDESGTALMAVMEASGLLWQAARDLAQDRRVNPRDDLMTALVEAEVEGGRRLTDDEIGSFMVLLSTAGNDTTRNTISHTMKALADHPDQRTRLAADLPGLLPTAVEEFVRWATPVIYMRRTTTQATTLGGQDIPTGHTVVMVYESANRDETVFADPWAFDVTRSPNPHLGFGGGGVHYCLGAQLAKAQLRSLFTELLTRAPGLEVGEPDYLASNFIHGIKRMPCRL